MGIFFVVLVIDGSTVVAYLPHHCKAEVSNLALLVQGGRIWQKSFIVLVIDDSKVVEYLPHRHKVEGLIKSSHQWHGVGEYGKKVL